jgi:methylated-DNA-[protein]-cysteine S-methyltransferase
MTTHTDDFQAIVAAPFFALALGCDERRVFSLTFLPPMPEAPPRNSLAQRAVAELKAWLAKPDFVFGLPLAALHGTPFQRRVWAEIAAIPWGETRSYGDLARRIGSAPRAIGGACAANPLPIFVPCHRVVLAQRGFGGFNHARNGLMPEIKRWLLEREKTCA